MNEEWSKTEHEANFKLLSGDNKPVISDLTFVELVCGCRNLSEFVKLINDMETKYILFSHQKNIKKITENSYSKNIKNESDLKKYKERLLQKRDDTIKPFFMNMIFSYLKLLCFILGVVNPPFWSRLPPLIKKIEIEDKKNLNLDYDHYYKECEQVKNKNVNIFYIATIEAISTLLKKDDKSLNDELIKKEINMLKLPENLSKITSEFIKEFKRRPSGSEKAKQMKSLNNEIFLMKILNNRISFSSKEEELNFKAMNLCVIKSGFCSGKFHFNDLVDLYNFSICGNEENKFFYFTDDKKWINIRKIILNEWPGLINL